VGGGFGTARAANFLSFTSLTAERSHSNVHTFSARMYLQVSSPKGRRQQTFKMSFWRLRRVQFVTLSRHGLTFSMEALEVKVGDVGELLAPLQMMLKWMS
jgi:hypothetical protein